MMMTMMMLRLRLRFDLQIKEIEKGGCEKGTKTYSAATATEAIAATVRAMMLNCILIDLSLEDGVWNSL